MSFLFAFNLEIQQRYIVIIVNCYYIYDCNLNINDPIKTYNAGSNENELKKYI